MMETFLQLVRKHHPEGFDRFRGVAEDEMARLEAVSPVAIPKIYREFLSVLGKDHGGVRLTADADTDFETVVDYLESEKDLGFPLLAPGFYPFAFPPESDPYCLDTNDPNLPVYLGLEPSVKKCSSSFEKFLCQQVYLELQQKDFPFVQWLRGKEQVGQPLKDFLEESGFRAEEFSDAFQYRAWGPRALVGVTEWERTPTAVCLIAKATEVLDPIVAPLRARFSLK